MSNLVYIRRLVNYTVGISRFVREDPTLRFAYDHESKEAIVSGMGELHLEIYSQVNEL